MMMMMVIYCVDDKAKQSNSLNEYNITLVTVLQVIDNLWVLYSDIITIWKYK